MATEPEKPKTETTTAAATQTETEKLPSGTPATTPEEAAELQHKAESGTTADAKLEKQQVANQKAADKKAASLSGETKVILSDRDADKAPTPADVKKPTDLIEGPRTEEYVPGTGTDLSEAQIKERDEAIALRMRLPNHENRDPKGAL